MLFQSSDNIYKEFVPIRLPYLLLIRRDGGRWMRAAEDRARDWRGLCPAVDCSRLMIMMRVVLLIEDGRMLIASFCV
jgi:hypothetical protein